MALQRIALAYSGSLASSAAVRWLMDTYGAEVVTVTVDVGQTDALEEVYARALACGATRAHVLDRRAVFARDIILPAVARPAPLDERALRHLADPVIASTLVEIAKIENADGVAHAATRDSLDAHIRRVDPALPIVAAARTWSARGVDPSEYATLHRVSAPGTIRTERHLLIRRPTSTASGCEAASVTLEFADGMPVTVNGVSLETTELIESLSLIGGRYGLSVGDSVSAPAMSLLQGAYAASGGRGSVTLLVRAGSLAVAGTPPSPSLVNP